MRTRHLNKARYRGMLLAILIPFFSFGAKATDTPATATASEQATLAEIVVTAQKRSENLQDVPIAVSAIGGNLIDDTHAVSLRDLAGIVPGAQFSSMANNKESATFSIRGVGTSNQPDAYAGSTVAVVVDGVPQFYNYGALLNLYDVNRIEVLRGPQGTLFGANTTGGVVSVISNEPTPDFGGSAEVSYGNYNRVDIGVTGNAPIANSLYFRLTAFETRQDGYVENVEDPQQPLGGSNDAILRAQLLFAPSSDFRALLKVEGDRNRDGADYVFNGALPGEILYRPPGVDGMYGPICASVTAICRAPSVLASGLSPSTPNVANLDNNTATLTIDWGNTPVGDITSISGYKHFAVEEYADQFGSPDSLSSSVRAPHGYQVSEELRTNAHPFANTTLIAGAFLQRADYSLYQGVGVDFAVPGLLSAENHTQDDRNESIFAQADVQVTSKLTITGGVRYTNEWKQMTAGYAARLNPAGTPANLWGVDTILLPGAFSETEAKTWNNEGGKVAIKYAFNDAAQVYGSWAHGFKSGGFTGAISAPAEIGPFKPEYVDTFEVGVKSEAFDRRLRVNAATFYSKYRDMQLEQIENEYVNGVFESLQEILNASSARIYGGELEMEVAPLPGLTLSGSLAYLHARYTRFPFIDPVTNQTVQLAGYTLLNAPTWNGHTSAEYKRRVGNGQAGASADLTYTSEEYFGIMNEPNSVIQARTLVNTQVFWQPTERDLTFQFWMRNAFNKHYIGSIFDSEGYGTVGQYMEPRMYGISIRTKF